MHGNMFKRYREKIVKRCFFSSLLKLNLSTAMLYCVTIFLGVIVIKYLQEPVDMFITYEATASETSLHGTMLKDTLLSIAQENISAGHTAHSPTARDKDEDKKQLQTDTQRNRIKMIQKMCKDKRTNSNIEITKMTHIYVNDKYKLLYCSIPKVACTNWKRILIVLSGVTNITDPLDISPPEAHGKYGTVLDTLDQYSPKDIEYRLKHYYKFMFVREPLERLYSAYKNKFTVKYNQYFNQIYGRNIVRKFRKNPSKKALQSGNGITFEEFVKYIIDPETRKKPYNEHWQEYGSICHPCQIHYDFIGKYETLNEDVDVVLKTLELDHSVQYPPSRRKQKDLPTMELVKKAIVNISAEDLNSLLDVYGEDYTMFGYNFPKIPLKN